MVFFWAFAKANFDQFLATSPCEGGSVKILNWCFRMPGHTYTWEYPEICSQVIAFLEKKFASNWQKSSLEVRNGRKGGAGL